MLQKSLEKAFGSASDSSTEQREANGNTLLEAMESNRLLSVGTIQHSRSQVHEPRPSRHCSANPMESIGDVLAKGYATVTLGVGVVSLLCGLSVMMTMTSANDPDFSSMSVTDYARVTARPW